MTAWSYGALPSALRLPCSGHDTTMCTTPAASRAAPAIAMPSPCAALGGVDALSVVMGLGFALMWSSAFTSARIIMKDCGLAVCWPPFQTLGFRFLISGSLGFAIALTKRQTWKDLTRDQWKSIVVFGTCQNALYLGLNFVAMQSIEASLATIIAATMPLLVAVLECVGLKKRIKPLGIFG
eukprot:COSAG06_NODE_27807_length_586_cov_0.788501_1_plen_180_part_10